MFHGFIVITFDSPKIVTLPEGWYCGRKRLVEGNVKSLGLKPGTNFAAAVYFSEAPSSP